MYNKSLDTASIKSMRKALAEVEINEADRAKHYKSATPPEDMKNNRKGKGAQDMMQPADNAIANPAADDGDKKIVPSGTPMKDPAGPVKTAESVEKTKPQWIIDAYAEMNEDVAAVKQNKPLQKKLDKLYGPKKQKEAKMDPVGKADADIDNDGDVDSSDKYLHNRRKAIKKAMSKK